MRLAAGLLGLLLSVADPSPFEFGRLLPASLALAFAAAGAVLLRSSQDGRAAALGGLYWLTAGQFGMPLAELSALVYGSAPARLLASLPVGYFVAFFLWRFAIDFPDSRESTARWRTLATSGARLSFLAASTFLLARVARQTLPTAAWPAALASMGWGVVALLALPVVPVAAWRARKAPLPERRRVRLFLLGLTAGFGPLFVQLLLAAVSPAYDAWLNRPDILPWVRGATQLLLLTVPFTTGYAVLARQALPVKLAVRTAVQYTLARSTLLALGAVPFLALMLEVVLSRHERVADVLGSRAVLVAALGCALAVALLATRRGALAFLDRTFFRAEVEAERTLAAIVQSAPRARDATDLGALLEARLDQTLHPERFSLLVARAAREPLRPVAGGASEELPGNSTLAQLLGGDPSPLDLDLATPASPLRRLPESERAWLTTAGFELLVPLIGADGELRGALGLGRKRSDLSYSEADRDLLRGVASSAALVLENLALRNTPQPAPPGNVAIGDLEAEAAADECIACGGVQAVATPECLDCGGDTRPALLPRELRGKFLLEKRLGAGGMGVVYLARDVDLGRVVALKTLPRTSEEAVRRLRREARAAAAVSHPHLATVFGLESWSGIPFVVMEYLPGGSLAERLQRHGPLPIPDLLALAAALADGLETAHAAGILHRDIKPSNVAFTASGQPKLLDFGLARILGLPDSGAVGTPLDAAADDTRALAPAPLTESGLVLGTPSYLSPEAARGLPPNPGFDLWSLGVLLYEATSGSNPFARPTLRETLEAISWPQLAPLELVRPECPTRLARLIADLLRADPKLRISAATELRQRLREIAPA